MKKALVTIEVEFEERYVGVQKGCSEIEGPGPSFQRQAEVNFVWELVFDWVENQNGFSRIVKVVLPKEQVQDV